MEKHYPMPIAAIEKRDKKLFEAAKTVYDLAMEPGELDARTKVLITLAIDATLGAGAGVKVLSSAARKMGASDAQITEVLRIAYAISGMGTLHASASAFESESK
jgi:AhpD family alkylhydroperoxidase